MACIFDMNSLVETPLVARPNSTHPTDLELLILKILWNESPLPVRDIRDQLANAGRDIAHTSVITTLNTMFDKKYLKRKREGKAFLFSPAIEQEDVSGNMLQDLVHRVFDGSASAVMLRLMESGDIDSEEVRELRRLFNRKLKELEEND